MATENVVVIIGGSYAGIGVAHALLKDVPSVKVVMISPHKTAYFNVAAPRILAKPDAFKPEQYLLPIEQAFSRYPAGSFNFIEDLVISIDPVAKTVTVGKSGDIIQYHHLVISSGGTTASSIGRGSSVAPFRVSNADDMDTVIKASQQAIAESRTIIIAGGGPVGVEFAGELSEAFKQKEGFKLTLLTQTRHLLPTLREKAGIAAERILTRSNVEVLTSRRVQKAQQDTKTKKWVATLDNGDIITADLYISATGIIPNNDFIPREFLSADGWVNVDDHFRVKGSTLENGESLPIYAVGDITSYPQRMVAKIPEQVKIAAANIASNILGHGVRPQYKPSRSVMMIVPVGRTEGTGQLFLGWVMWSWLAVLIKGRDFFISRASQFLTGG